MKKVVLIGDSIRMGYQQVVQRELADVAEFILPDKNGGNSRNVLANLDAWAVETAPDLIHINCGLHDLKHEFDAEENAVPLGEYTQNVGQILDRLTQETQAQIVWAKTTPVNQDWHHDNKPFDRFEADVRAYNEAAVAAAQERDIPVNDLYKVIMDAGRDALLRPDGVHFTEEGSELLGNAVADFIRPLL